MENKYTLSGLAVADFNKSVDGKETTLYILTNKQGMEVTITNYGAKIVSLMVPDKDGKMVDVVTGHSSIDDYLTSEEPYFGAVCGRYGNRIAGGKFSIDGIVYDQLAINNGPNCLHGGVKGFNAVVWDTIAHNNEIVTLNYTSPDGEEGFPGELGVYVTYLLTDKNELYIYYVARTDKPTVLNLTNHSYFNLSGAGDPTIEDHRLLINADYYLPIDQTAIPYGPMAELEGTPMDFFSSHEIGKYINEDFEQLKFGKGYDHTYILNKKEPGSFNLAASCGSLKTNIIMTVHTTEPGLQLYTGNWMTGNLVGKHGQRYPARAAFCLETQHFPDSPNKPGYPSTLLRPGETFTSTTAYRFSRLGDNV